MAVHGYGGAQGCFNAENHDSYLSLTYYLRSALLKAEFIVDGYVINLFGLTFIQLLCITLKLCMS